MSITNMEQDRQQSGAGALDGLFPASLRNLILGATVMATGLIGCSEVDPALEMAALPHPEISQIHEKPALYNDMRVAIRADELKFVDHSMTSTTPVVSQRIGSGGTHSYRYNLYSEAEPGIPLGVHSMRPLDEQDSYLMGTLHCDPDGRAFLKVERASSASNVQAIRAESAQRAPGVPQ